MNPEPPPPWRFRFGIGSLLLLMVVTSVMAAAAYHLVRSWRNPTGSRFTFILFTLAAPAVLLLIISVGTTLLSWLGRRPK